MKVLIESDVFKLEAFQLPDASVQKIMDIIFSESLSTNDKRALATRDEFRVGRLEKIPAISAIRKLFADSDDERKGLKEAKEFIER